MTPVTERLALPDRTVFWRWVWTSVRPVVGWALAAAGAVCLFVTWYLVSGQAIVAKQLPYLVSGGLAGVALFIMAGVFLATDDVRRELARVDRLEEMVGELYALLVEPVRTPEAGALFALPNGTSYHRPDCPLVAGKQNAAAVTAAVVQERGLRPCRVCDPGGQAPEAPEA